MMKAERFLMNIWGWYAPDDWSSTNTDKDRVDPAVFLKRSDFRRLDNLSCGFGITLKTLAEAIIEVRNVSHVKMNEPEHDLPSEYDSNQVQNRISQLI